MISKRTILECDWCGQIFFGFSFNDFTKNHYVYRFKSINPMADESWLKDKPNQCAWKHLSFCDEYCAEAYFKDSPEDRPFYKLINHKQVKPKKHAN